MTTYGTIPSQENASSSLSLLGRAKELISLGLSSQRPWLELVQCSAFSLPISFTVATERIKTNIMIFRTNYIIIFIVTIFISMLWQPVHLSVFFILIVAWLYVYSRDNEPWVIFGSVIDDSTLVLVLLVLTIGIFLLTDVSRGIMIGVLAGLPVVLVHGMCRNTEMLFVLEDDEEKLTINTASSSLSSSS
ncbi:Prenylated rab acceptor PRA1 [Arabidopsis thaliana x Arabidopsis arenosa]|uniref:PRA1 family protein n=1 Tax=Arabidopsis thaliana x Arabidopsis arenosa TaxID=1240361 RepID=A0A8T1Y1T5_9BRAS|nr:Prenylated rab acceptor PRA1 [Arabidopsis thaliana x Arabidopsis arenosa]